ncbi:MAG: hypothetical protein QNJ44_12770 [Rhodobacter sp.]|nr:hypothetical protein [Rhodobacter sp.]
MSQQKSRLGDPVRLSQARAIAHAAVQPLTRAARANLPAAADDSHSNLEWSVDHQMFLSHPLGPGDTPNQAGLSLAPLRLVLLRDGEPLDELTLAGQRLARVTDWLDNRLREIGLDPGAAVDLPYALPEDAAAIDRFGDDDPGLPALAAWFSLAATVLTEFARTYTGIDPGPSAVRCWPHHFDIATYVGLERGDPETAKGIGVGLSPGDDSYNQPYFYVNPWPHLDATALPDPIAPGHWHTEGFVGAIATGREILTGDDPAATAATFLHDSFAAGRESLRA